MGDLRTAAYDYEQRIKELEAENAELRADNDILETQIGALFELRKQADNQAEAVRNFSRSLLILAEIVGKAVRV